MSTHKRDRTEAIQAATRLYYEAEFKAEKKLPQQTRLVGKIADMVVAQLEEGLANGTGKENHRTYISSIQLYIKPFFGRYRIDGITPELLDEFNVWRLAKMRSEPAASTINNHNVAFNKIFDLALANGWVTPVVIPKLTNAGRKRAVAPEAWTGIYRA